MREHGILDGPADDDAHSLNDVASLLVQPLRVRKDLNMTATEAMRRAVRRASLNVLTWLAARVDSCVMRVYCHDGESVRRSSPSLKHRKDANRRYAVVSQSGAWEAFGKARVSRANLRGSLRLRDDAAELGCHDRQADRWIEARNGMHF